jgi:hypothetical protein
LPGTREKRRVGGKVECEEIPGSGCVIYICKPMHRVHGNHTSISPLGGLSVLKDNNMDMGVD